MKLTINKAQAGDTIVEVLIAIAVASLILGGAYSTASLSLRHTQQAQERTEATRVAETQTEILNTLAQLKVSDPGYLNVFNAASPIFCLHTTGVLNVPFSLETINSSDPRLATASDPLTHYQTCTFNPDNTSGASSRYNTAVIYDAVTKAFTIQIRWLRLGGGTDELKYVYRAYNGS